MVTAIGNLALIRSDLGGSDASIPVFEAAIGLLGGFANGDLADAADALAIARLRRNYAASLRKSGRLAEAAVEYDNGSELYSNVLVSLGGAAHLVGAGGPLEEAATVEAWRMVTHMRCDAPDRADFAATAIQRLSDAIGKSERGDASLAAAEAAVVEAWTDAAFTTFPTDRERAISFHEKAIAALATIPAARRPSEPVVAATRRLAACSVRREICSGRVSEAWKRLDKGEEGDAASLVAAAPVDSLLDVAISLLAKGRKDTALALRQAYLDALTDEISDRNARLASTLEALRACGVDAMLLEHLRGDPETPAARSGP